MDTYTALSARRSAKTYADPAPPREVIQRLIEAATWAPNHHLTQPWRFTVITGPAREQYGNALAEWLRTSDAAATMPPTALTDKAIESTRVKPLRAPILIIVSQHTDPAHPERDLEDYAAVCAATQNLLLAATAEGLVTKWSTGDMCHMPPAHTYANLTEGDRIVAFVYLGYPESAASTEATPPPPTRTPPDITWHGTPDE